MRFRTLILPCLTATAFAALAVPLPAAGAKLDAAAVARRLAPFLDDQVVAVVRLDLAALNVDEVADRLGNLLGLDPQQTAPPRRAAAEFVASVRRAGAGELYAVLSLADFPMPGPFVLVPLGDGAKADEVRQSLVVFGKETVETIDGVVFAGGRAARARLRGLKPSARPGLEPALAAVADAPVQVVFVPGPDLRRVVGELTPQLPNELGGGPGTVLTRGIRWAALGLEVAPKLTLKLTVQSEDAAAAQALADVAGRGLRWAARQEEAKRVLPQFEELVPSLTPRAAGDRLTLTIDETAPAVAQASATLLARARAAAGRTQSTNNLKQIGLALHNYHDVHKAFPPTYTAKDGKPLLSWRVHILPYVEQDGLYKEFKLDEPWDSEHNKKLIARMPATYRSPASKAGDGKTTYLAPRGPATVFPAGGPGLKIQEITDGTSNTVMAVEAGDEAAVEWTKPDDLEIDPKQPLKGLRGPYEGGFNVLFADGSVRFLKATIDPKTLNALFTRNGGEAIGPDF
jgi:prepilin-type processing-associated H-X9-DG protein